MNSDLVKAQIAEDMGLAPADIARLYDLDEGRLDRHLATLGADASSAVQRILADVDAARIRHRYYTASPEHGEALQAILKKYPFHSLVSQPTAAGGVGGRLGSDDAQYVAYRAADIVQIDFDWGDVLRPRLHRVILYRGESAPAITPPFRDHLVEITLYLLELTGVL